MKPTSTFPFLALYDPFRKLVARIVARDRMRRSFRPLLDPPDDRLLDDIGVTRAELAALIGDPMMPPHPFHADGGFQVLSAAFLIRRFKC